MVVRSIDMSHQHQGHSGHTQNPLSACIYNSLGVSIAAGALYPAFGLLLSPMIAAVAMNLSSVSVMGNALRLRHVEL